MISSSFLTRRLVSDSCTGTGVLRQGFECAGRNTLKLISEQSDVQAERTKGGWLVPVRSCNMENP